MTFIERAKGLEYGGTTEKKDENKKQNTYLNFLDRQNAKNADKIAQKLQSLLTNYSNNVANFYNEVSSRYEGRAFDFNDNYIADAGAWNESTKQKVDFLKAEKTDIENFINSYGNLFDQDWVSQITSSLNSNTADFDNVLKNAQSDADFWGSFENENQYNEWAKKEKDYFDNWGKYSKEKDFNYYSFLGASAENPTGEEVADLWGRYYGGVGGAKPQYEIGNIVTFMQQYADDIGSAPEGEFYNYKYLNKEEVNLYNYLLAKNGKEAAQEYLDYMADTLTQREAQETAEHIQNIDNGFTKAIAYGLTAFTSGVAQNIKNVAQFFSNKELSTSKGEYVNQYLQQDLSGLGKYLYQATNTVGNMLPSILLASVTGGAGAVLGATEMGISAAGGAYKQALQSGMNVGQARIYSTLVGAAEGGLQYALGGISKLGGSKSVSSLINKASRIENVFLRVATKYGASIGSEILEEELQNFIEPLIKTIVTGEEYETPTWEELLETAIVTAISTGALEGGSIVGGEISAFNNAKQNKNNAQEIVNNLLELNPDNKYAIKINEQLQKGKTLKTGQVVNLIQETFRQEVANKEADAKFQKAMQKVAKIEQKQGKSFLPDSIETFNEQESDLSTIKSIDLEQLAKDNENTQIRGDFKAVKSTKETSIDKQETTQATTENKVVVEQPKTIEEASKKYGKQATAMAKAYLPNQDVEKYSQAFDQVYSYAKSGVNINYVKNLESVKYLTDRQLLIAYEMGEYASKQIANRREVQAKKATIDKTKKGSVTVKGENINLKSFAKKFNTTQKQAYNIIKDIAEATGLNVVLYESQIKDGVYQGEQGKYNKNEKGTIYIDINAGLYDIKDAKDLANYTMLRTFTHEFVHFIEDLSANEYNVLRKEVFKELTNKGINIDSLIEKYTNSGLSFDNASREVVAEGLVDVLNDSTFLETLAKKNENLFQRLAKKLKEFLAKIKEYFAKIAPNYSSEAEALKGNINGAIKYVDNIVKAFDKAALSAVENLQKIGQQQAENKVIEDLNSKGIAIDEETDTAVMLSARHAPKTEEEIETTAQNIQKALGVTIQEARQWVKDEVSLANLILNDKYAEYLDYDFDGRRAAIQKNADYKQGTVDFSNLCRKRIDYTNTMNKVLKNFPNRIITAEELAQIRQIMVEEGIEVACGVCFVEDRRQNDTKVADLFVNDLTRYRQGKTTHEDGKPFNERQLKAFAMMGGESYTPNLYELVTREGLNKLSREHKSVAEAWNIYNNARGMQAVRLIQNESEYKREILKYSKDKVRRINNAGGLRIFSFSDFTEYHLIDIVQIIQDCAVMGIKIQGYTKVPAFAKLVEKTGVKLNRSLIPKGELGYHLENGKVVLDYDRTEGIDIEDENFVDTTDNPDVGNIVIGINDEQISAAMLDDFIDYIIPFHTGQSKEVLRIKKLSAWNNYKDFQTDKEIETGTTAKKQVNIYTDVLNAAEKEGKPITNKVEFVNKYLEVCKEKGLKPRFWQFLNKDANGDYSYREGYHKLLLDFKMFDKNGNILQQKPVTPNFDAAFMMDLLKEYAETKAEKSKTLAPKLEKVYERITKEILTDDAVQYQNREYDTNGNELSQKQSEYFADSLITDNNGNLKMVYHGSSKIFTKFDHSFIGEHGSMEGQGFYFTDKKEVAESYQRKGGQLLEGYLNITKPLSDSEITLQKAEVRKLLKEIDPTGDDIVINYDSLGGLGYPSKAWYERALSDTVNSVFKYSETDSEILADIANSGGQRDVILKVRDILGYDGYIVKNKYDGADVYVAFDSNQFKLASNKNPTANEDIQYQMRSSKISNREILEIASNEMDVESLTSAEQYALDTFKYRLEILQRLEEKRLQVGSIYVENQFRKDGDRELAKVKKAEVDSLDVQIKKANESLLEIEQKGVLIGVLNKARKVIEGIDKQKAQESLKRYKERAEKALTIKAFKDEIIKNTNDLKQWILKPDNKNDYKHVPEILKNAVVDFLARVDFTSKRQLKGGQATISDKEFAQSLVKLEQSIGEATDIEGAYSGFVDLPQDFLSNLRELKDKVMAMIGDSNVYIVNRMTAEELEKLSEIVYALKHYIPQINKLHTNAIFNHVYEAGDSFIANMQSLEAEKGNEIGNYLLWKSMRPADVFKRFGSAMDSIYKSLRAGQGKLAFNTQEVIDETQKIYTEKEIKEWSKEKHTIKISNDTTLTMTTAQLMGLYCLANQPDSLQHIYGGGIRVPTTKIGKEKIVSQETQIQREDLTEILKVLTDRQKSVAKQLQQYMATKGAEWGNFVSMARFGVKSFTNPLYYPINSDGRHLQSLAEEKPEGASLYALLNLSFTKARNEKADNRLIVYSIFDVFANHMASMAQYNALALPVLDAIKFLNYSQKVTADDGRKRVVDSVKDQMDRVFGVPTETKGSGKMGYAQQWFSNIIKAFSGTEAQTPAYDTLPLKGLQMYNRAKIAYNLRVAVQQPMSILRAGSVLKYSSILKGLKLSPNATKENVKEMLTYSGVAVWKVNLGFYDVNVSKGLTTAIKHDETGLDKFVDAGMILAQKADEMTWGAIWRACKEEIKAKNIEFKSQKEYFEAVKNLFEDVIYETQVVDSVLTKPELMRQKSFVAKAVTSFMSEPLTAISNLVKPFYALKLDMQKGKSFQEAWKSNSKDIGRAAFVYGLSTSLLAVAQSAIDSLRDDDDYETTLQKFWEAYRKNLLNEASLLGKIPIVSQFKELAKELFGTLTGLDVYGYEPQYILAQYWDTLVKAAEIAHNKIVGKEDNYTIFALVYKLLDGISSIVGLPIAPIIREIQTLWNNTVGRISPSLKLKTYDPGAKASIKYAYLDGWLKEEEAIDLLVKQGMDKDDAYFFIQKESKYDALYESILSGEGYAEAVEHLTEHGVTMDNITSTARSQIHKWLNEETITKDKAIELLVTYGELKKEDAQSRVEFWAVTHENNLEGFTEAAYKKYLKECAKSGMDVKVFYNAWKYKNEVDDKRKVLDYIYTLDIPSSQKIALIKCWY